MPGRSRWRRRTAGQALAEFAIAAVPVLFLLLGIIQFALIYNSQVGLTNAIRDAARYGSSLAATDVTSAGIAANKTNALLRASLAKYISPYDATKLATGTGACYVQHPDGAVGTDPAFVRVTVAYNHPLIVPLIGGILDGIDGTADGAYRITVTTELRVDNPTEATLTVGTTQVCNT